MENRVLTLDERYGEILRFLRRRVEPSQDAEDVAQEVYASAAETLRRSAGGAPPTLCWLYTVARRRLADRARRREPRMVSLELVADTRAPAERYGPLVARALERSVRELPEAQRDVVVPRLLEGRSFAALAGRLGITEEACRMRFMRGLEHLRRALEEEGIAP